MSRLQRSSVSFRRQGSSGRIWDDPLRGLVDLKGTSASGATVAPLHPDASILAGDRSVRHGRHRCGVGPAPAAGAVVAESPDDGRWSSPSPASGVVFVGADGARHDRPARRRRRISSAFCACMGHPPASHAQQ